MKILCPVDFSETSIQAAAWATRLLHDSGEGHIDLVHFINLRGRAEMFRSIDEILTAQAEKDFDLLFKELRTISDKVSLNHQIHKTNSKEGIVQMTKKNEYDLVLMGSNGLTGLKNIILGSVTRYIFNHSITPVMSIPGGTKYTGLKSIALAVDDRIVKNLNSLQFVKKLCTTFKLKLKLVHVTEENESVFEYDPSFEIYFKEVGFEYVRLPLIRSVNHSLNSYCINNNIDILAMLHKHTNWFINLFVQSYSQKELYSLPIPFLVIR